MGELWKNGRASNDGGVDEGVRVEEGLCVDLGFASEGNVQKWLSVELE